MKSSNFENPGWAGYPHSKKLFEFSSVNMIEIDEMLGLWENFKPGVFKRQNLLMKCWVSLKRSTFCDYLSHISAHNINLSENFNSQTLYLIEFLCYTQLNF